MSRIRFLFLGLTVSASIGFCQDAAAQHCSWRFDQSFALLSAKNLRVLEIDDHTRRNEVGAIQGKVEAILNWMKTVTPAPGPQ